jgi:hypothetical protein
MDMARAVITLPGDEDVTLRRIFPMLNVIVHGNACQPTVTQAEKGCVKIHLRVLATAAEAGAPSSSIPVGTLSTQRAMRFEDQSASFNNRYTLTCSTSSSSFHTPSTRLR